MDGTIYDLKLTKKLAEKRGITKMRANGKRMVKQLTEKRLTSVSQQQRTSRSQNALLFGLEGSMERIVQDG